MVRMEFLPYCLPQIEDDEIAEVVDTLKSGWLSHGPKTTEFEKRLASYVGSKHAIAVNSCTAALHLSLIGLGIGPGDEVITSPYTFASSGNVICHTGARPVLVDVEKDTFNIGPENIRKAITPRTKAIMPVHYGGQSCDMDAIMEIAEWKGIPVVEDAAHALGAHYNERKIGTIGKATCFSFYATKNITTGEGGAVVTDDDQLADKIRILRLHGISKDAWQRYSAKGTWYYEIEDCGWKYNMTDIQAAIGLHQLEKIDRFTEVRRRYATMYDQAFEGVDRIMIPVPKPYAHHAYHLYPMILREGDRNQFIEEMKVRKIGTSVHFIPLHLHPFYRNNYGFRHGDYPVAEWLYEREVSLPLYPKMTSDEVTEVAEVVKEVVQRV